MAHRERTPGILLLEKADEDREIEFELAFLSSLTPRQRFILMMRKSREMRLSLRQNGHRTAMIGKPDVCFPSLEDMIRMKKAASRAKDREDLKFLRRLLKAR